MAGEDRAYADWVRQQRCLMAGADPCLGDVQAHHAGLRQTGHDARRAHDHTCLPLCLKHHDAWHAACGVFLGWRKPRRRAWADDQVRRARARWERHLGPELTG